MGGTLMEWLALLKVTVRKSRPITTTYAIIGSPCADQDIFMCGADMFSLCLWFPPTGEEIHEDYVN